MSPLLRAPLFLGLALALSLNAPPARGALRPSGRYEGRILIAGQPLGIKVTFKGDSTDFGADIDIPQQGALALPLVNVRFASATGRIHFELPASQGIASFDGTVVDAAIRGDFSQAGFTGTFELTRASEKPAAPAPAEPPPPYRVEEVKYLSSGAVLAGTLTRPEGPGPFPAVLLLTGSGPQNRDEEIFGFQPFRAIADRLTRGGIAVLRSDDRGVGGSTGTFATALTDTFVKDALAGVRFLKSRAGIDPQRIGLLGHSEGGLVAAMAAVKQPDIAFLVLLAGPALRGDSLLLLQGQAIGKLSGATEVELEEAARQQHLTYRVMRGDRDALPLLRNALYASLKVRLEKIPEKNRPTGEAAHRYLEETLDAQLRQLQQPWFRRFVELDPADYIPRTRCPILALFGEKDCQVPARENREALEQEFGQAAGGVERRIEVVPGVNHLFEACTSGAPSEYASLKNQFAPGVLDTLASWIGRVSGPRK